MRNSPVDLPYLPDDLLLNCLARVSRLYYPILSLVSKRFRSLVASPELYEIRKLLGRTENCLYVCLSSTSRFDPHWFTLCRRPTRTPKPNPNPKLNSRWFTSCFRPNLTDGTSKEEKKLSEKLLVSVPSRNHCPRFGYTIITLGSNIYMIDKLSSRVFFMDCRSHTWHENPRLRTFPKLTSVTVSVIDGKIYVVELERCIYFESSNLVEVFDPETQIWECVPNPSAEIRGRFVLYSLAIDGKLYLFGDKDLVYKPKENIWDVVGFEMRVHRIPPFCFCVIDKVIYYYNEISRMLEWYDPQGSSWGSLKGLEELPELPLLSVTCVRLVDSDEKIAVFWEKKVCPPIGYNKKMIWCAEIALERRNAQEIYGKIEWCDVVLTLPKSCSIFEFNAVSITV